MSVRIRRGGRREGFPPCPGTRPRGPGLGADESVATGLLDDHLKHCVLDAAKLSDEAAVEKIQEATDAINRLVRS